MIDLNKMTSQREEFVMSEYANKDDLYRAMHEKIADQAATIAQLQLDNARMREALGAIRVWCESPDTDLEDSIGRLACEALAKDKP